MIIENSKTYNVTDVENIFFRPTFCGKPAEEFGVRVLYNMPMPTKCPVFRHNHDIIKTFSSGWQGGTSATMEQIEIPLDKLKAESAYSAESYFSTVYEQLLNSADVNMGDLSGTDLEKAETEIFRRSLADSVYAHTWFGDADGEISDYLGYSGFIRRVVDIKENYGGKIALDIFDSPQETTIEELLRSSWTNANDDLRALASDGQLVFFVSSDIYDAYQFFLDENGSSNAYADAANGRPTLSYHGIPLVEVPSKKYNTKRIKSFCILTDRRNFVLALNTADSPEKEIRMWYNPDEMENRQRVVFLAGTAVLDKSIISGYMYEQDLTFL